MENKEDEDIEKLVEQMLMKTALESPSVDFTKTVMSEVLASAKSKSLVYKPIISGRNWLIIFAGIIALFIYSYFNAGTTSPGFNLNFTFHNLDKLEKTFHSVQFSSMTGNVILLTTVLILIQIFFLKKYLDKRFES
ncbi:MAG: hypothetical protein ABI136_01715 [Ginsengibacter sp.]